MIEHTNSARLLTRNHALTHPAAPSPKACCRERHDTGVTPGWPAKDLPHRPRTVEPASAYCDAEADSCRSRTPLCRESSAGPGLKLIHPAARMLAKAPPLHRPRERNRLAERPRCLTTLGGQAEGKLGRTGTAYEPPPALTRSVVRFRWGGQSARHFSLGCWRALKRPTAQWAVCPN